MIHIQCLGDISISLLRETTLTDEREEVARFEGVEDSTIGDFLLLPPNSSILPGIFPLGERLQNIDSVY